MCHYATLRYAVYCYHYCSLYRDKSLMLTIYVLLRVYSLCSYTLRALCACSLVLCTRYWMVFYCSCSRYVVTLHARALAVNCVCVVSSSLRSSSTRVNTRYRSTIYCSLHSHILCLVHVHVHVSSLRSLTDMSLPKTDVWP
jgi:hypothetical protein